MIDPVQRILYEAQEAGASVCDVVTLDEVHAFLFETNGARHLYVQPRSALPGEHHAWVQGSWPAACALERGSGRVRWSAPGDAALERWLASPGHALSALAAETPLEHAAGSGTVRLDWVLQLTSLGDGRSHLVMQSGRSERAGIARFQRAALAFASSIGPRPPQPKQHPLYPVAHAAMFERVLLGSGPLEPRKRRATPTSSGETNRELNHAGGLLFDGRYEEAMWAYGQIAEAHPELRGICYAQIGSALYFMGHPREAIHWYEAAIVEGADPDAMGRSIAEAQASTGEPRQASSA